MQDRDCLPKTVVAGLFAVVLITGISFAHAADTKLRSRAAPSTWQIVDVQPNGNVITLRSAAGVTKRVVVESATGLRQGTNVICTEDCGDQIGIGGDAQIRIVREMK